jgi:hypothetical protein
MVTAAGFQLKGSGWYATDFKNGGAKPKPADKTADKPADKTADKPAGTASEAPKGDAPSSDGGGEKKASGGCGGGCSCH